MDAALRQQFHEAYITGDKGRIGKVLEQDLPLTLIKFCSGRYESDGRNVFLDTVKKNKLWLSSPKTFNDPFDCVLNTDYEQSLRDFSRPIFEKLFGSKAEEIFKSSDSQCALQAKAMEVRPSFQERDQSVRENLFVSCFSEKRNLDSLCMWGHYANCHTGFCIEYDFREIHQKIHQKVQQKRSVSMVPIVYQQTYSVKEPKGEASEAECRRFHLEVIFTKALEWEYENEWRLLDICEDEKGKNGFPISFIKPVSVYIGCKASELLIKDLTAICTEQKIPLFQMEMKPGSFALINHPIL